MTLPSWREPGLATMARAALWLVSEVGEGSIFTKSQLRGAFPEVAQIDRRIRDLRSYGWEIHTRREDPGLRQEEQRLVAQGLPVWEPETIRGRQKSALTITQRQKVLAEDNHLCRSCGATAGDLYADGVTSAQLDVARRTVALPDGSTEVQLVTECNKCRVGNRASVATPETLIDEIKQLTPLERRILAAWIESDHREFGVVERLWAAYRTLPAESREHVRAAATSDSES